MQEYPKFEDDDIQDALIHLTHDSKPFHCLIEAIQHLSLSDLNSYCLATYEIIDARLYIHPNDPAHWLLARAIIEINQYIEHSRNYYETELISEINELESYIIELESEVERLKEHIEVFNEIIDKNKVQEKNLLFVKMEFESLQNFIKAREVLLEQLISLKVENPKLPDQHKRILSLVNYSQDLPRYFI